MASLSVSVSFQPLFELSTLWLVAFATRPIGYIVSASLSISVDMSLIPSVGLCVYVSVCLSGKYCGETAVWIRMPFGVVRVVGQKMGVLDGGGDRRREGAVLGVNLGRPIVINQWELCCVSDALFPSYSGRTCHFTCMKILIFERFSRENLISSTVSKRRILVLNFVFVTQSDTCLRLQGCFASK